MEVEEIEAALEKIWDLHDKLSEAIHSISRAHFLTSVKSRKPQTKTQADFYFSSKNNKDNDDSDTDGTKNGRTGYVFVKDYGPLDEDDDDSAVHEAKSLNSIRTALENLEDQLEFFHSIQTQQRAERDAAVSRLEKSRFVVAMRLAEHHGNKYKVIEEARAFIGDVHDATPFISPQNLYASPQENKSNFLNILLSKFNSVQKCLKLDQMGGIIGNAALVAMSMLVLMHAHQVGDKGNYNLGQEKVIFKRNSTKLSLPNGSSSSEMDVLLARG